MKSHYKFLWMALLSILFLGACSSGADDILELDTDKLTISTPNLTAEAKGGIGAITFTTNKSWTATSDQNWCKLDKSYGNASNITINFTLEANPTTKERTAKITINAGTANATATVKQAKREEDKITLNESNFTAEANGKTLTIPFTTNKSWTVTSDKNWCSLNMTSGQAGTINLQVTIEANPTTEERTAKITINADTASATVTVKQAKKENGGESGNGNSIDDMQNQKW